MAAIKIVPLEASHYEAWYQLYQGYADHYQVELAESSALTTWSWLLDPAHPLTGLVAVRDGVPIGLAHFRAMPSPLRGREIGFLDDLFVDPGERGSGIASMLLETLRQEAAAKGWPVIRWITRDDNYRARTVYDRHAVKTDWNTYEMMPDQA
ncbi:N-acetyltransferase family protein [Alphaproteobacteria bacterium LSUCC0684]